MTETIQKEIDGHIYEFVKPHSCNMYKELSSTRFVGYSFTCIFSNMVLRIFYKSGSFFDTKKTKIADIYYDPNTELLTCHQYGFENEHNTISLWKEIVQRLRPEDKIIVRGKTRKSRVCYSTTAGEIKKFIDDENCSNAKYIYVPKTELFKFFAKKHRCS